MRNLTQQIEFVLEMYKEPIPAERVCERLMIEKYDNGKRPWTEDEVRIELIRGAREKLWVWYEGKRLYGRK